MIKNIVFDIGNVLAKFGWREYLDQFNLNPDQDKAVAEHLFLSPMWREVDRGVKTDGELLREICADVPEQIERLIRLVFHGAGDAVIGYNYSAGLLEELKEQGYKVYLLSNYGKTFFEDRAKTFDFLKYIDGKVLSYEIKAIKPEPKIYKTLFSRYHLNPEECLYFDDLQENLDAGAAFGMKTVLVKGYDSIVAGLDNYGIEI